MSMPIPVPTEAIDFTPPELWPVIWELYPSGLVMPSSVPKGIWERHWKHRNKDLAKTMKCPPPPPFVKGYWGRLNDRALTSKKRKAEHEQEELPRVYPPQLSHEFWRRYFELFPDGHSAPPYQPPTAAYEEPPKKYAIFRGQLHVNVGVLPDRPIWKPSTGADAWDPRGNWIGPA